MKKVLLFLAGLMLIVLVFCALGLSAAIYDTGGKATIEPYFFQPDDNYSRRPGVPATPADLGDANMRDKLIAKYITEYFYVTPDMNAVSERMTAATSFRRMSTGAVFQKWLDTVAPQIEEMAKARMLRTVSVVNITPASDKYVRVEYELRTWQTPNDFSVPPVVTNDVLFLDVSYKSGMRDTVGNMTTNEYLESGGDPAAVFYFGIRDVATTN